MKKLWIFFVLILVGSDGESFWLFGWVLWMWDWKCVFFSVWFFWDFGWVV